MISVNTIHDANAEFDSITTITGAAETLNAKEDIDATQIQAFLKDSRQKFERNFIRGTQNVNFSDSIVKNKDEHSYEIFSVEETYEMKLKRIKQELEELRLLKESEDSLKGKEDRIQPVNDIDGKEVEELLSVLNGVQQTSAASTHTSSNNKQLKKYQPTILSIDETKTAPSKNVAETQPATIHDLVSPEEVQSLEERIFKLESLIGYNDNIDILNLSTSSNSSHGLQNIESLINDMNRKFKLLVNLDNGVHGLRSSNSSGGSNDGGDSQSSGSNSSNNMKQELVGNKELIRALLGKMESINKDIILNNKKLSANQSFYLNNYNTFGSSILDSAPSSAGASSALASAPGAASKSKSKNGTVVDLVEAEKINKLYNALYNKMLPNDDRNSYNNINNSGKSLTDDAKINDGFSSTLPNSITNANVIAIIKRLSSLNSLYLEYKSTMELSSSATTIIDEIEANFKQWYTALTEANSNLSEFEKELRESKVEIEAWVNDIEQQVEKLKQ